ncbi:MAG: elongation factor P-like protein YeiP [Woeseiaceae bacterium]
MPKANELKSGMVVEINGVPHSVKNVDAKSPHSRGGATLYKVRYTNLKTGQKLDESHKGDEILKEADCNRVQVQFSYVDGDDYAFMNTDDYSQYTINSADIEDAVPYLTEGLEGIFALIMDEAILGIELPHSVNLTITETAPSIKGSTAAGRTKPATLNTGLEIQVPEYIELGQEVKVNTTNAKFMSRV